MDRKQTDLDTDGFDETISGLGTWTGLLPAARELREKADDLDHHDAVDFITRQNERFEWFAERIDRPRTYRRLRRILSNPPREPSAWERAMVELTLLGSTEARVFLETWEPPDQNLELDTFRQVCTTKFD